MKKLGILTLVLSLTLLIGASALGENLEEAEIIPSAKAAVDLDGDGADELIFWCPVPLDEYSEAVSLQVDNLFFETGMLYSAHVYAWDVDGDGQTELFISGDEMSDDYYTYAFHYEDGALKPILFEDQDRGGDGVGIHTTGYGQITAFEDGVMELAGTQDILGTYLGVRRFALKDNRFVYADDGLWRFPIDYDYLPYRTLRLTQPLVVTLSDGTQTMLSAGVGLMVTASDLNTTVYFQTEDGLEGRFSVAPDEEQGWGYLVEGVPENDLFEFVPYAD